MKRWIAVLALLIGAWPMTVTADDRTEVEAATARWIDAFNRKSSVDIVALYADDAVFFGTGAETRDFIHIDDLVAALRLLGERPDEARHLACNVASGIETRIDEAVAAVAGALGAAAGDWRFSGEVAPGAPSCWRADIGRLERLGFTPLVSFDEGVRRTVAAAIGESNPRA